MSPDTIARPVAGPAASPSRMSSAAGSVALFDVHPPCTEGGRLRRAGAEIAWFCGALAAAFSSRAAPATRLSSARAGTGRPVNPARPGGPEPAARFTLRRRRRG